MKNNKKSKSKILTIAILPSLLMSLESKNSLMDFNEIWYQQHSFIGADYAEGVNFFSFLHLLLVVAQKCS